VLTGTALLASSCFGQCITTFEFGKLLFQVHGRNYRRVLPADF
jgi:hypothetical protein